MRLHAYSGVENVCLLIHSNVHQFCVSVEGVHGLITAKSQVCGLGTSAYGRGVDSRIGCDLNLREPFVWARDGIGAVVFALEDGVYCLTLDSRFDEALLSLIIEAQRQKQILASSILPESRIQCAFVLGWAG